MTTLDVLLIGGWLGYSFVGSYFWRRWAWEFKQDSINSRVEAILFGLGLAMVWPIALTFRSITRSDWFMLPPRAVRQREREEALEARIAQLERDAGISGHHHDYVGGKCVVCGVRTTSPHVWSR